MANKYNYLDSSDGIIKDSRNIIIWNVSTSIGIKGDEISPLDTQNWRFSILLRNYRKDNDLTMKDLGEKIGVTDTMISRVENQNVFNEKIFRYYLANSKTPIEDLQFILTGVVD